MGIRGYIRRYKNQLKWDQKTAEKHGFWGSKKRVSGAPGRGVLRFWVGGIQESRSFFGQKRPKNQKIVRFRGWCNI